MRVDASRIWTSRHRHRCREASDGLGAQDRSIGRVGTIDAVGPIVVAWTVGQRVAVGFLEAAIGGEVDGDAQEVSRMAALWPGGTRDRPGNEPGHIVADIDELMILPPELDLLSPASALAVCIAVALERSLARAGEWVAVLGLCAIGCIGVQIARGLGCRLVAISSDGGKRLLAGRLGASLFIDVDRHDPMPVLAALGGITVILTTTANRRAVPSMVDALRERGRLLVLRESGLPLTISAFALSSISRRVDPGTIGMEVDEDVGFSISLSASLADGVGHGRE